MEGARFRMDVREDESSAGGEAELRLKEVGGARITRFVGAAADDTDSASLVDSGRRRPGGRVGATPA